MNALQYFITEFLNQNKSEDSRLMLLAPSELPGSDWLVRGKRTWRTGSGVKHRSERSERAYRAGVFCAWCTFKQLSPIERNIWTEVMPFATEADAEMEVPNVRDGFVINERSELRLREERLIDDQKIPGVSNSLVLEQLTIGRNGPGIARYAAGNVDRIVFVISCFGDGDCWSWNEVMDVASKQAEKIREALLIRSAQ